MFGALANIRTGCLTNITPKNYRMRQFARETLIAKRNYYTETPINEKKFTTILLHILPQTDTDVHIAM
jgi:hypothetical protein